MSNNIFEQLSTIEQDQKQLDSINRLQTAFDEVRSSYSQEYNTTLSNVLSQFTDKLKANDKMKKAVDTFVSSYVKPECKDDATESLYNMLAAELLQTFQAVSHASCAVM